MKQVDMERERAGLEAIKAKMTESQRKDMAELLANELRSRAQAKRTNGGENADSEAANSSVRNSRVSTPLNREQVRDLYQSVNKRLTEKRAGKNTPAPKLPTARPEILQGASTESVRDIVKMSQRGGLRFPSGNTALMAGIAIFGSLKILLSTGIVSAAIEPRAKTEPVTAAAAVTASPSAPLANPANPVKPEPNPVTATVTAKDAAIASASTAPGVSSLATTAASSPTDRAMLTELESRRVELEKRRVELEHRAEELAMQEREMSSRLAELRTLTRQLSDHRVEKDQGREARIEQLANVYGAMAPQEAAPLISKLDEDISLDLLQRLPGKRMAQILSAMDQMRAVEITKKLSERAATPEIK